MVTPQECLDIIKKYNETKFDNLFDPLDILAFIQIESGFKELARRYEPRINDASYGLMQILFSTARDRGYTGYCDGLFDVQTNINYGMAQLLWLEKELHEFKPNFTKDEWIAAYNEGLGNVLKGHKDIVYVNKWKQARINLEAMGLM